MESEHDAAHPNGVCFCKVCRADKLQKYRNMRADVLRFMLKNIFPYQKEVSLKKLHRQTLETVVVSKAWKTSILQDSKYKYLKTHFKKVDDMNDIEAGKLADEVNQGCRVYDKWEKIEYNFAQCSLIDRRQLSVNQLYRAQEFAWCLQFQDNIRKRSGKPAQLLYSEEKFETIKDFIKGSGIIEDIGHDPKQITALCSRIQRELVMNPR